MFNMIIGKLSLALCGVIVGHTTSLLTNWSTVERETDITQVSAPLGQLPLADARVDGENASNDAKTNVR